MVKKSNLNIKRVLAFAEENLTRLQLSQTHTKLV